MSITTLGVKRAMRALEESGFRVPQDVDRNTLAGSWRRSASHLSDSELEAAAVEYTRRDHPAYAWPTPGQLVECASHLKNRADGDGYKEPEEWDQQKATPEDVRKAWEAHVDLDELKRLHQARQARKRRGSA